MTSNQPSRETETIITNLNLNQVWSLLKSLDFWLDVLPPKISQLSLEGPLKANAQGQVVFQGKTYTFQLISWQPKRLISLKLYQDQTFLCLLQLSLSKSKKPNSTQINLDLVDATHAWWHFFWPKLTIKRWFEQLSQNLRRAFGQVHSPETSHQLKQPQLKLPKGFYLWRQSNEYTKGLKKILKPFNLTPTQYFILKAVDDLYQKDKTLMNEEVATALAVHPVVVSDTVKALVKKNLVRKIRPPDNKRAYHLIPSPIGKQLINLSLNEVTRFETEFFSS